MKFAQNNHPTRLFGPIRLFGTWEYIQKNPLYSLSQFVLLLLFTFFYE